MYEKLKNLTDVDIIFLSGCDHYDGTDNHGLYQMFKFFKKNLNRKSIYINMLNSKFKNNEDVFDISGIVGPKQNFARLANRKLTQKLTPTDMANIVPSYISLCKLLYKAATRVIPHHKIIILGDKWDVTEPLLAGLLTAYQSKIIYVSMVNNLWTAACAYPMNNKCDKYKIGGCDLQCPFVKQKGLNPYAVPQGWEFSTQFFSSMRDSIYINVGNTAVLKQANESILCRDLKKFIIPLQTVDLLSEKFEEIKVIKKTNRDKILKTLKLEDNSCTFITWSAFDISNERKGFQYFIDSLKELKNIMGQEVTNKICIFICGRTNTHMLNQLNELKYNYVTPGLLEREQYTELLSMSDVYCSTTIEDAGPRTTYEAGAAATPIISFDNCNSIDFVNKNNGALIKTYDVKGYALAIAKMINLTEQEKFNYSHEIYKSYKDLMNTERITNLWKDFFNQTLGENNETQSI